MLEVEDQERRLEPLRLLGRRDVPPGVGGGVLEFVRERGMACDHDQPVAAARGPWLGVGRPVLPRALAVVVVPAPALAAEATGGDRPNGDRRRPPAGLAEALLVERARDVEAGVDPHEVHQLERPHAEAARQPADAIDGLDRCDSLLEQLERLEPERAIAAIDQEPGAVGGVDHVLAHRLTGGARQRERRLGGLLAGDDLEQAHHRRRVEEVHPDDALGLRRRARHRGHEQRGSVRREHALVRDDLLGQAREQLALDLEALGCRLDHELARREVL